MTGIPRALMLLCALAFAASGGWGAAQSAPDLPEHGAEQEELEAMPESAAQMPVESAKTNRSAPVIAANSESRFVLEAGEPFPVLVELYTSQGCGSCPPADALLTVLAGREGVLPISFHIDYWDYLGWADPFAQASHTKRQEAYARAQGERLVSTPQIVVNGAKLIAGARASEVAQALGEEAPLSLSRVRLEARVDGPRLELSLSAPEKLDGSSDLSLVRFLPEAKVAVKGGENAGLHLRYTHVVTDWLRLARWDGASPLELQAALTGPERAALVVQSRRDGRVLAVLVLR